MKGELEDKGKVGSGVRDVWDGEKGEVKEEGKVRSGKRNTCGGGDQGRREGMEWGR